MTVLTTVSDRGAHAGVVTDHSSGEVPERAKRRTFTAAYKLRVLAEYEAASPGERGVVLRRALAARGLGVRVLRDATLELLDDRWGSLDDVIRRRARHVVTENARVLTAVRALRDDDRATLRATFAASQDSLAHDFEVSVPELDLLVQLAGDTAGVVASRMTGAGFGGCTVSLVERNHAEAARDALVAAYVWATGLAARSWLCTPSAGASVLGAA